MHANAIEAKTPRLMDSTLLSIDIVNFSSLKFIISSLKPSASEPNATINFPLNLYSGPRVI